MKIFNDNIVILEESDRIKGAPPYSPATCISASYKIDLTTITRASFIAIYREDDTYEVIKGRRGENDPCLLPKKVITKIILR
jgi:hypothetical protein